MAPINVAFRQLADEVTSLVKCETSDSGNAIEAAQNLGRIAISYREEICKAETHQRLKDVLRTTEIPFPITNKTIEMLWNTALQFNDRLKEELSQTARLFFEHVICQCIRQKRRLYKWDEERFHANFKEMVKTLPEREVLTSFQLKCCRAALKNLTWKRQEKEAVKNNLAPLAIGGLSTLFSVTMKPPFVNPTPLLQPGANFIQDIYKALPELWYRDVLALKWCGLEFIRTKEQFETVDESGKSIKKLLKLAKKNHKVAFYICQLFMEIIRNNDAEQPLKDELFEGDDISILRLANYYTPRFSRSITKAFREKHWAVRYLALTYLKELSAYERYTAGSLRAIIELMTSVNERIIIRKEAYSICKHLLSTKQEQFTKLMETIIDAREAELLEQTAAGASIVDLEARQQTLSEELRNLEHQVAANQKLESHSTGIEENGELKVQIQQKDNEFDKVELLLDCHNKIGQMEKLKNGLNYLSSEFEDYE